MSTAVPLREPEQVRAGDTWHWRREDLAPDYPASQWTLTYRFKNEAGGFEAVASADGDYFNVVVAAATTANYSAGRYAWQAQVSKGAEKYTVSEAELVVQGSLFSGTAAAANDQRSHARKVLDAIEAVLERRATQDQMEYEIAGRRLKRTAIGDLLVLRDRYRAEVAREEAAERAAAGLPDKRRLYVRLNRV
jgi:hypothetical protein